MEKIKLESITKIEKIIHLADIHIRLYKRHNEYRYVFETLYKSIKEQKLKNAVIVIAGDVVHSKTDMSPEMVKMVSDFFKNLSDIHPTIVIAGNHDCNLSNPNRLDALSPIIENLDNKNLFYLKNSGIYVVNDVEFGVLSILDGSDKWPSAKNMSGTKIALFHGPINQAKTSTGFTISNKMTIDGFNGFDMVLLGDIHKAQLLQRKDINFPEIMYPGSLIQQNHGEGLDGHGYVIWDVNTSTAEKYVEVPNKYGYLTIKMEKPILPVLENIPENIRLRLLIGDVDATDIKKALATLRKKYNIIEYSVNKLIEGKIRKNSSINDILEDITDVNNQNELIKKYIENHKLTVSDEVISNILEINALLNDKIGEDELPRNIHWRPILLKFDNLFSYGEGNEIKFEDMDGLYGVFSPNATGKTSAFDALCFALYDKTPRAFKGSNIMNTRCDEFFCSLELEIENKRYIIERTGTRKKNNEVKVDVEFFRIDAGIKVSLNGEDRRNTNANIRSYVGTYEDFILTTLSVQNQNSLFIDTGQSDRKDLLSQFIGLTIFDRLFNLASDEIKEIAGSLKNFKQDDFTQTLVLVQNKIDSIVPTFKSIEREVEENKYILNENTNSLKKLYNSKLPIFEFDDPIALSIKTEKEIHEIIDAKEASYQNVCSVLINLDAERKKIENNIKLIPIYNEEELNKNYKKYLNSKEVILKLKGTLSGLEITLNNKSEKLQNLKLHKWDPNCEFCINNIFTKDTIHNIELISDEVNFITKQIDDLKTKIWKGEWFVKENADIENQYSSWLSDSKKINSYLVDINELDYKLSRFQLDRNTAIDQKQKWEKILNQFIDNKNSIELNNKIDDEIKQIEILISSLDKSNERLELQMRNYHGQLEVLYKEKEQMIQKIKEAKSLEKVYEAYENYLLIIGHDGLPYELISQIIPTLETEVNTILSQIVNFNVLIEVDGKNINGRIIYGDNKTWPLELASGMEKFISGLAMRIALMKISNLPKSNFLVIDEGLGVLDSDNLSSMNQLFGMIKEQFDFVILISHLDIVKDITDNLIEIKRDDNDMSYINF